MAELYKGPERENYAFINQYLMAENISPEDRMAAVENLLRQLQGNREAAVELMQECDRQLAEQPAN